MSPNVEILKKNYDLREKISSNFQENIDFFSFSKIIKNIRQNLMY